MNRLTKLIAVVAVFGLLFASAYVYAQEKGMTYREYSDDHGALSAPRNWSPYTASFLVGHRVYGGGSWELGTISDFIIDQTNGRVALVILSDVPEYGTHKVAIPFGFLTRDPSGSLNVIFPPGAPVGFGSTTPETSISTDARFPYARTLAIYDLKGIIDCAWVTNVYKHYGYAPYWLEGSTMVLYTCGSLLGADFHLQNSDAVVRANDFVIDSDGHISYVVLSDVPGRKDMVAVPFALFRGEDPNACVFAIPSDRLASAPAYAQGDFGNRVYVQRIYTFYGVQPYWTER